MQKLIAILFLIMLCGTTLTKGLHLHLNAVEQLADSDKSKELKPDKKDGKEFEAFLVKKHLHALSVPRYYTTHAFLGLPSPVLKKPTPPPNVVC